MFELYSNHIDQSSSFETSYQIGLMPTLNQKWVVFIWLDEYIWSCKHKLHFSLLCFPGSTAYYPKAHSSKACWAAWEMLAARSSIKTRLLWNYRDPATNGKGGKFLLWMHNNGFEYLTHTICSLNLVCSRNRLETKEREGTRRNHLEGSCLFLEGDITNEDR